jgi:two-component system CheB/CheR fusion protein
VPAEHRIVGIGASAGGVEALRLFFQNLPEGSGVGFVVILHLAPNYPSLLADVIGRWTKMPVAPASEGTLVAPDHVYVNPHDAVLSISDGRLRLRRRAPDSHGGAPIDVFFSALAIDHGANAVGVVLSGTGNDGALGLKAIKSAGGVTLAQGIDGGQPRYGDMPAAAIATGAVDLILPVEAMPERILSLRPPPAANDAGDESLDVPRLAALKPRICAILRGQVGHDFSGYKEQTFMRRVTRRMLFVGLDAEHYVERLAVDHAEVALLFRDLLIGVTSFFRDPEIFHAVEESVVPLLFHNKSADGVVRVWVPGCATGEEAYSLAILLREYMSKVPAPPMVQIFATDIDDAAIAVARAGRYPAAMLEGLSRERRDRFFTGADGIYSVAREVRDLCTFSAHSVIRDPPFSRTDLISCRNLLIYLDAELQARVVPAFHYALRPGGILLLGGSEAVMRHADLFVPLDKKHRIFRRRDTPTLPLQFGTGGLSGRPVLVTPRMREPMALRARAASGAGQLILDRYAPAFVVVNGAFDVLHFSSHTGRYLEPASGAPTQNLIDLARRGLKLELRAALREASESGRTVQRERVPLQSDGVVQPTTVTVERLADEDAEKLYLVVFADSAPARRGEDAATVNVGEKARESLVEQLESDLRDAREHAQSVVEEYETALEELKSANEELHSVNEDLQSTNEEIETSKEEIQSMNEELQTVNVQLSGKLDELDRSNSDLRNLFESTRVATVFLDRHMVLRGFTPAVAGIYNLIPSDHGRPLTDIASQIDYPDLQSDMTHVLATLQSLERRVTRRDGGAHYLMRLLPYRTSEDRVDGALITFVDVTSMVRAEEHQRLLVDELNHRVRNMLTVVISLASQTLRGASSMDDFSNSFLGRLQAMAGAYALLSRDQWRNVPLLDLLIDQLRPYTSSDPINVDVNGPPLLLSPRAALALSMIVHELATNAQKYGALSVPRGTVAVRWRIEHVSGGEDVVHLSWQERGGPPAAASPRRGFGSKLIERTLRHELEGTAAFDFAETGLRVALRFAHASATDTPAAVSSP